MAPVMPKDQHEPADDGRLIRYASGTVTGGMVYGNNYATGTGDVPARAWAKPGHGKFSR